jgi:hypothetical protein
LIQSEFQNGDIESIKITIKKMMEPKEISLHFLIHLDPNENFDDDLLQDAVDLLHTK